MVQGQALDIGLVDLESGTLEVPVSTPALEVWPSLSPDGRYVAYGSNEGEDWQVYVRDLETGGRIVASPAGGGSVVWSPDGATLYFAVLAEWFAAPVTYDSGIAVAAPRKLFDMPARARFPFSDIDLSPDGTRFMIMTDASSGMQQAVDPGRMHVILNWAQQLRERVQPR